MEAQTAQPPTSAGSSSSSYPKWVMLKHYCRPDVSAADDAKTTAVARTSIGHLIQVSLRVEEPLATATVCIQAPDDGSVEVEERNCAVVAAHGDSLLIRVGFKEKKCQQAYTINHFVYNAGDAAATNLPRPPSLSLLPPCDVAGVFDDPGRPQRHDSFSALGLQRRGEDELLVAELRTPRPVPELCLFRSGKWSFKRVPISYSDVEVVAGGALWEQIPSVWNAVPVSDRLLCWVHLSRSVMVICGAMFEDSPWMQYLRLPVDPCLSWGLPSHQNRNVCATTTAGDDVLKLVNIIPHCGNGAFGCERSHHAYTIHTWIMRMDKASDDDKVEWVNDGMIDCAELWALDDYKGLPCVPLDRPIVSMDELHVIYFQLSERHHVKHAGQDTLWLLKLDMRSKTIQSVSCYVDEDGFPYIGDILIPSNVSYFFNSYHDPSDGTLLTRQKQMGIETRPPVFVVDEQPLLRGNDARNPTLQPSSPLAEPSQQALEFLEAFLEISRYGLNGGDELKAYRILSHDNGSLFRSLLRLPNNLRKDWMLMQIKASQPY